MRGPQPLRSRVFGGLSKVTPEFKLRPALPKIGTWTIAIIKRSVRAKGFEVLPRCWVAERTFAWLGRDRRLA